jgi:hypothetical protein
LQEGTLSECIKFDIKINSTIPKLLGLPEIAKNIIEGVVVKSIDNITMPGSRDASRAIWKVKNAKFAEVNPPAPGMETVNLTYSKIHSMKR